MTLDEIRPFIAIELQGCPVPIIDSAVKLTIRDFLRRSEAWRETITVNWAAPMTLGAAPVQSVLRVWDRQQQREVKFMAPEQLRDHGAAWQQAGPNPLAWSMDVENVPVVYPAPADGIDPARVTNRLDIYLVRNVSSADQEFNIPAAIWDRYEDAFRAGSLARLMKIPARDWTDPQRAGAYGIAYEQLVREAKTRAAAGFGRPSRVVRYGGY